MGLEEQTLRRQKMLSELFEMLLRSNKLSWWHHLEVSSLKLVEIVPDKKLPKGRVSEKSRVQVI